MCVYVCAYDWAMHVGNTNTRACEIVLEKMQPACFWEENFNGVKNYACVKK